MPASLVPFPENHKLDYDHEHIIGCSHCRQKYLLVWDDKEWNYAKDWIHLAEGAEKPSATCRNSVAAHTEETAKATALNAC